MADKIIQLPKNQDLVERLRKKLVQYAQRASDLVDQIKEENPYWHPELVVQNYCITNQFYKLAVLSELLEKREIGAQAFSLELAEEYNVFDINNFNQACGVIDDYCRTGGAHAQGGTDF